MMRHALLKLWLGIAALSESFCLADVCLDLPIDDGPGAVSEWTEMFVPYAEGLEDCDFIGPYELVADGVDKCRQHLHIAVPSTPGPHPLFLWSHQSGAEAADVPPEALALITGLGYAVVSWESLTNAKNEFGLVIAEQDSRKVVNWIAKNKENCRFDASRVIISGRSRGTIVSWKMAHWGLKNIIGIYMYNALPGDIWEGPDGDTWTEQINITSAPIFLSYGPSCPHPIQIGSCVPSPDKRDIHNPENGAKVVAQYNSFSPPLKSYMVDGLSQRPEIEGLGVFYFLPAFVDALEANTFPESMPVVEPEDVYGWPSKFEN